MAAHQVLELAHQQLHNDQDALLNSRSWTLTAPLRRWGDRSRRLWHALQRDA